MRVSDIIISSNIRNSLNEEVQLDEKSYEDPDLSEMLRNEGYTLLGRGKDQSAWLEPDTGLVVKIFGTAFGTTGEEYTKEQRSFLTFYELSKKYSNNKFLPNIIEFKRFTYKDRPYLWIKMERLFPFKGSGADDWRQIFWTMCKYRNSELTFDDWLVGIVYNKQYEDAYHEVIMHLGKTGLKSLWNTIGLVINEARKNGYNFDYNTSNIMLSSDGDPVIVDPYALAPYGSDPGEIV